MTDERRIPDADAADDPRVSDAYRDLARERAPGHLDRAVLREAEKAARPRYSRLRLWTRPAAWAAVVLLSATLLLQVSQVQPPQQDAMPQREEAPVAAALEEAVSQDADLLIRAEEMARMQQGPNEALAGSQPAAFETVTVTGNRLPACDDEARATPETWLDCILELEEVGMDEEASQERALLVETFPDFQAP